MEDLDPEEARAVIDPAPKVMIDAAHRYDCYVVQSTRDGTALFGAPAAHEDNLQWRALYAALKLQEELKPLRPRLVRSWQPNRCTMGGQFGSAQLHLLPTKGPLLPSCAGMLNGPVRTGRMLHDREQPGYGG